MVRDESKSCARNAGLQCISQEIINWASKRLIDCLSIFTPVGSKWAQPNVVTKNPNFMKEAQEIQTRSLLRDSAEVGETFEQR